MKTLIFECRGELYKIKKNGDMLQVNNTYNEWDSNWQFLGVSFHNWRRGIDKTVKEAFNNPASIMGGLVWDIDHNTIRQWGGNYYGKLPRITRAHIEDI